MPAFSTVSYPDTGVPLYPIEYSKLMGEVALICRFPTSPKTHQMDLQLQRYHHSIWVRPLVLGSIYGFHRSIWGEHSSHMYTYGDLPSSDQLWPQTIVSVVRLLRFVKSRSLNATMTSHFQHSNPFTLVSFLTLDFLPSSCDSKANKHIPSTWIHPI